MGPAEEYEPTTAGVLADAQRRRPAIGHRNPGGYPGLRRVIDLFASEHRGGLALEVDVRLAADVDRDAVDRAACELVGVGARVVVGDRFAAVASDAQPLAGDHELAGLGLDIPLADLGVPVPQREHSDGHARWVLSGLVEGGGVGLVVAQQLVGHAHGTERYASGAAGR